VRGLIEVVHKQLPADVNARARARTHTHTHAHLFACHFPTLRVSVGTVYKAEWVGPTAANKTRTRGMMLAVKMVNSRAATSDIFHHDVEVLRCRHI
jgi:hypothetical protein